MVSYEASIAQECIVDYLPLAEPVLIFSTINYYTLFCSPRSFNYPTVQFMVFQIVLTFPQNNRKINSVAVYILYDFIVVYYMKII